jgi:hypothetical protein
MSQAEFDTERDKAFAEPLLPVEKKLIGWSLGIGIVALIVLVVINHLAPIQV